MANATKPPTLFAIPAGTSSVLCRGATCGARIYFVRNPKTGKLMPLSVDCEGGKRPSETKDADQGDLLGNETLVYDGAGQLHFLDCPDADSFSRGNH